VRHSVVHWMKPARVEFNTRAFGEEPVRVRSAPVATTTFVNRHGLAAEASAYSSDTPSLPASHRSLRAEPDVHAEFLEVLDASFATCWSP